MQDAANADAPILVVDDQPSLLMLAERVLRHAGYQNIETTTDPRQAITRFGERRPDLVLLDLHMPVVDGFQTLDILRGLIPEDEFVPVIVLTADTTLDARRRALAAGATDFLTKPFDATEVRLRVRNALTMRRLHTRVREQNAILEQRVAERTRELERARLETLDRLAVAAEFRDDTTGQHTARVSRLSAAIARIMSYETENLTMFARAAALHDIGKLSVPDRILLKPGALATDERDEMRKHTLVGAGILAGSQFDTLRLAADIALTHHERWDGAGYPRALAGPRIPLAGRIVAVADVFDALTHERPYKLAWPVQAAIAEIQNQAGAQFDPEVVSAFLDVMRRESTAWAVDWSGTHEPETSPDVSGP